MPPLPVPFVIPSEPLQLYRHLLREASYLPLLCRPWITSRIQDQCRKHAPNSESTPYRIKNAQASLRYLRSANAGHLLRLEHLCRLATGRTGKRRRILSSTSLAKPPATNTDELERLRLAASSSSPTVPASDDSAREPDWLDNWSVDRITALATSQLQNQKSNWVMSMRKNIVPPDEITKGINCLGRPYRPSLIRNRTKRHYVSVLNQILPPLPSGEWHHLGSLVNGDTAAEELKVPTRRLAARSTQEEPSQVTSELWNWHQHVIKPARVLQRGSSRRHKSLTGLQDQDPRGQGRPIGVRIMSPKRLQRLYAHIYEMSPIMNQKPGTDKWTVSWGQKERKVGVSSSRHNSFFQGVNSKGEIHRPTLPAEK
ncbi:hypothetical protein F5Y16DRAFT_176080 [Xylariaceae sp. FL0255]|nr:hypothetical protein F5Y16DRAFT_176080 [Xylariaceae sp. FL0255]